MMYLDIGFVFSASKYRRTAGFQLQLSIPCAGLCNSKFKTYNSKFKIQNAKFIRMQAHTNFEFRFVINDVLPQLFLLSTYARGEKAQ